MRQSLKSPHFYAPAIFVTLILFDEIDSIFSLSLSTEHSEFAEHADYTPNEFSEYNVGELQPQSRDDQPYKFESILNDVDVDELNGDVFGSKKLVSDCMNCC